MAPGDPIAGNPYKQLLKRFFITFLLGVVIYRLGVIIPAPGIDVETLRAFMDQDEAGFAILRWADMFNGGAISNASIFGLGIMPYISASIIFQLLTASYPALKALQKEGEVGRRKIQQYTRYATVVICLMQGGLASIALTRITHDGANVVMVDNTAFFAIQSALVVTTGSMILLWIAEQITKFGIGNGVSVVIMISILASMAPAMTDMFQGSAGVDLVKFLGIVAMFIAIIAGICMITLARRHIHLEQQRRIQGNKVYGGGQTQLPLMINQANVIPVIFASPVMVALVFLLTMLAGWAGIETLGGLLDYDTPMYRYIFAALIIFFTYFYISITFDLNDLANHFKQAGFFVRGVRPGRNTVDYIRWRQRRVTFVGATTLALIAVSPGLIASGMEIGTNVANAVLGGVGLLIVVGVSLDIIQKTSAFLLANQYQGLMGQQGEPGGPRKGGGKRF
ncbi:MAG: preprotein translocase subunit SecY [Planctomycetota bacterium]|nr:MAG: preprotein translocase subunit SecY [Planctomycetota bacterium]